MQRERIRLIKTLSAKQTVHQRGDKPGLRMTATHVLHSMVHIASTCSQHPEQTLAQLEPYLHKSEHSLRRATDNEEWSHVNLYLIALQNSKLQKHVELVKRVANRVASSAHTKEVQALEVVKQLKETIGHLPGKDAEDLLVAIKQKDADMQPVQAKARSQSARSLLSNIIYRRSSGGQLQNYKDLQATKDSSADVTFFKWAWYCLMCASNINTTCGTGRRCSQLMVQMGLLTQSFKEDSQLK